MALGAAIPREWKTCSYFPTIPLSRIRGAALLVALAVCAAATPMERGQTKRS